MLTTGVCVPQVSCVTTTCSDEGEGLPSVCSQPEVKVGGSGQPKRRCFLLRRRLGLRCLTNPLALSPRGRAFLSLCQYTCTWLMMPSSCRMARNSSRSITWSAGESRDTLDISHVIHRQTYMYIYMQTGRHIRTYTCRQVDIYVHNYTYRQLDIYKLTFQM